MHSLTRAFRFAATLLALPAVALAAQQPAPATPLSPAAELVRQGRRLVGEGKYDDAVALYAKAIAMAPDLSNAHLAAGVALDLKGDYSAARVHIQRAIETAAPDVRNDALRTMALSYAFERNAGEAIRYEKQVYDAEMAKLEFDAAAGIANELGRICLESGDYDNATIWYGKGFETAGKQLALTDTAKDLWAFRWHNAQARIAARRGKGAEALKHVHEAKEALESGRNPEQNQYIPYLTGYVAFYTGDVNTAIADLQKAEQRDPFILSLLAQAYEKKGDQTTALEYWKKVLTFNGHNPPNVFARPLARKRVG